MIDLTKDQQNALDYIVENDWDVFILTGNAGTGKSTLLEIIQKSFKKEGRIRAEVENSILITKRVCRLC